MADSVGRGTQPYNGMRVNQNAPFIPLGTLMTRCGLRLRPFSYRSAHWLVSETQSSGRYHSNLQWYIHEKEKATMIPLLEVIFVLKVGLFLDAQPVGHHQQLIAQLQRFSA